jgi:hypothetical protein
MNYFSKKRKESETTYPTPSMTEASPVTTSPSPSPMLRVGDRAWYFRLDATTASTSTREIYSSLADARKEGMAKQCMLVCIKQVHYDDMPNLYYTIGMLPDDQVVFQGLQSWDLLFQEEKQTDACWLIPLHNRLG